MMTAECKMQNAEKIMNLMIHVQNFFLTTVIDYVKV